MIFTTTRELFLDYASTSLLCSEWPPGYTVDLINVGIPRPWSVGRKNPVSHETYDESMVSSSFHSEGCVLDE